MLSLLGRCLDVNKKAAGDTPAACLFHRGSLIVRLADRHLVDRHLVFPARAADVPVPLCRDPAARLVLETWVCSVGLDFVVCPWSLFLVLNLCLGHSHFATRPFTSNRPGKRFGLNDTIGMVDGFLISQNLMIRLDVIVAVNFW